jgi:mitochondrial import inner membrane translocase subunit TIM21
MEYKGNEDGSNRTRVRYNMEGRFGTAFVFAEVSPDMPSGEFVYILVQDKTNERVQTIVDNQAALTAKILAGGNEQTSSIMSQLLTGASSSSSDRK